MLHLFRWFRQFSSVTKLFLLVQQCELAVAPRYRWMNPDVDNGGRCDLRVSFVLSVLRFFSRTFAGTIDKESLSRLA